MAQNMTPDLEQRLLQLQRSVQAIRVSLNEPHRQQAFQRIALGEQDIRLTVITGEVQQIHWRIALPDPWKPGLPDAHPIIQRSYARAPRAHLSSRTSGTNTTYACSCPQIHMWMAYE
jgi:hypothetical protein